MPPKKAAKKGNKADKGDDDIAEEKKRLIDEIYAISDIEDYPLKYVMSLFRL
jgi:hypothetical protein